MTISKNKHYKDILFDSPNFNKKIIDSLPGIFYFYHVTKEGVFLKRWNKKHVTELGYSDQELLNISGSIFYTEKEFTRIKKTIEHIFIKGWNDIHTTLITKVGKRIPYYLQGYALHIDGEAYFMGVGINMSKQHKLKKKLVQSEKQQLKEQLKKKEIDDLLNEKKRELLTHVISETHTSQNIKNAREKINKLLTKYSETDVCDNLKEIDNILSQNISKDKQWEIFKLRFKEIHPSFFNNLLEKYPNLTNSELKFCAYLRLNLSSNQIAALLNISKEGIRKARYRIRKKMDLDIKDSLEKCISKF